MPKRENNLLVEDLISCFNKIMNYTKDLTYDEFVNDDKTVDAVVRNFEIIGEASKRLSDNFKIEHPQVEWRLLTGFRNRLIHEYFGVDYETVWTVIQKEVQEHLDFLETIEMS